MLDTISHQQPSRIYSPGFLPVVLLYERDILFEFLRDPKIARMKQVTTKFSQAYIIFVFESAQGIEKMSEIIR